MAVHGSKRSTCSAPLCLPPSSPNLGLCTAASFSLAVSSFRVVALLLLLSTTPRYIPLSGPCFALAFFEFYVSPLARTELGRRYESIQEQQSRYTSSSLGHRQTSYEPDSLCRLTLPPPNVSPLSPTSYLRPTTIPSFGLSESQYLRYV